MGYRKKSLSLPNILGTFMKKQIRFEHNIKHPKSQHGKIVMMVIELHNGMPVDVYTLPILKNRIDDYAKYRFYKPNFN